MKRLASHAALALASLLFALGGAELVVRWSFHDLTTTSPIDSWFGRRWKAAHLHRHAGFRDRPFPWEKPAGELRIVVIGDSLTVAMGLPEAERYGERIEAALGPPFRVIQMARPGEELDGHLATLRRDALRAEPDFVLLQFYVNDFEISKLGKPRARPLLRPYWLHKGLYRHSALYTLAAQAWWALQPRLGLVEDYASYMERRYGDPRGESLIAVRVLREFFALCRRERLPVGGLLFPPLGPALGGEDPFDFLYDRVLEECERAGVVCVDLRPVFAPYADDVPRLRLNRFDHHASAFAHELAAGALLEAFGERWRALPLRASSR